MYETERATATTMWPGGRLQGQNAAFDVPTEAARAPWSSRRAAHRGPHLGHRTPGRCRSSGRKGGGEKISRVSTRPRRTAKGTCIMAGAGRSAAPAPASGSGYRGSGVSRRLSAELTFCAISSPPPSHVFASGPRSRFTYRPIRSCTSSDDIRRQTRRLRRSFIRRRTKRCIALRAAGLYGGGGIEPGMVAEAIADASSSACAWKSPRIVLVNDLQRA